MFLAVVQVSLLFLLNVKFQESFEVIPTLLQLGRKSLMPFYFCLTQGMSEKFETDDNWALWAQGFKNRCNNG